MGGSARLHQPFICLWHGQSVSRLQGWLTRLWGDTEFASESDALWDALGIGGLLSFADDKYAVYGETLAKTGLQNLRDRRAVNASMGGRVLGSLYHIQEDADDA